MSGEMLTCFGLTSRLWDAIALGIMAMVILVALLILLLMLLYDDD